MKKFLAIALVAAAQCVPASAAVLYSQVSGGNIGWCSSCSGTYRGFATFDLGQASTIDTVEFGTDYASNGGTVSIWTADQSTMLFEQSFGPSGGGSTVSVSVPNWTLAAGNYLFSAYSGSFLTWTGSIGGDDYQVDAGARTFNMELDGVVADVPEPAMLGLFGMGAIGLGLSRRRKAA